MRSLTEADIVTKILAAPSGRYAVMARKTPSDRYVQIESCDSHSSADELIQMYGLDEDSEKRAELIEAALEDGDDWGDDAPRGLSNIIW